MYASVLHFVTISGLETPYLTVTALISTANKAVIQDIILALMNLHIGQAFLPEHFQRGCKPGVCFQVHTLSEATTGDGETKMVCTIYQDL